VVEVRAAAVAAAVPILLAAVQVGLTVAAVAAHPAVGAVQLLAETARWVQSESFGPVTHAHSHQLVQGISNA